MREAVKALREKGLVEAYAGRGTFITSETSNSIRLTFDRMIKSGPREGTLHLVEVREILEPEIAALATTRADQEVLAAMREQVEVMDASKTDPDAYIEADLDFHLALAEAWSQLKFDLKAREEAARASQLANEQGLLPEYISAVEARQAEFDGRWADASAMMVLPPACSIHASTPSRSLSPSPCPCQAGATAIQYR